MFLEIKICATLLLLINIKSSIADENQAPIVKLPQGQIQGHILQSLLENKPYYAYQEIPYAAPPVGDLRFKEPTAPENWDGVKNTNQNTRSCYLNGQVDEIAPDVTESEDCLYLNVYTPVEPGTKSSLPVLFWIHGGGFYFGDGTFQVYGPQYLINQDIVIVTINYRLGAFGFLTTEDGVIPGNLGLKDQNFALQWTKTNIGLFGGNPEQITIVGESAGGASVGFQLISKKSDGLFVGAVLQSGTAICSFSFQRYAKYYAFEMGKQLNETFDSEDSAELLKVLQKASAEDINKVTIDVPEEKDDRIGGGSLVWIPIIESETLDGAFITASMYSSIKLGNINQVPIMIGYNSEEEIVFIGDGESLKEEAAKMDKDLSKIVKNAYDMKEADKSLAGGMLRQLYTSGTFQEDFSAIVKFKTDADFSTPIIRHAELQSSFTKVYLYQFSYKGMMGCTDTVVEGVDTVGHAEDLKYLWHIDRLDDDSIFPAGDKLNRRRLLKLWSNFVKYQNPTPEADPLLDNVIWPSVTSSKISYLNINRTLEVKTNPRYYQDYKKIVERYAGTDLYTY